MSSCQSFLSPVPAGETIFAQIGVFICLLCLFCYPPDNVRRMSGAGRCWGVSALGWDEGCLYYHFKWPACRVLWFRSSRTCHASLSGLTAALCSLPYFGDSSGCLLLLQRQIRHSLRAVPSTTPLRQEDGCNTYIHTQPAIPTRILTAGLQEQTTTCS